MRGELSFGPGVRRALPEKEPGEANDAKGALNIGCALLCHAVPSQAILCHTGCFRLIAIVGQLDVGITVVLANSDSSKLSLTCQEADVRPCAILTLVV